MKMKSIFTNEIMEKYSQIISHSFDKLSDKQKQVKTN